jgi:hypothetical protein
MDGPEPIMLCLSGLHHKLRSKKLGDMIQASVLPLNEPPQIAVKTGLDKATCGDCSRRFSSRTARPEKSGPLPKELLCPGSCTRCRACWPGSRTNIYIEEHGTPGRCYVLPWTGPKRVWESYVEQAPDLDMAREALERAGRPVRITSYGDMAAVPPVVWKRLIPTKLWGPAYTRRWRSCPEWKGLALASVESVTEAREAQGQGWRTYRIGGRG